MFAQASRGRLWCVPCVSMHLLLSLAALQLAACARRGPQVNGCVKMVDLVSTYASHPYTLPVGSKRLWASAKYMQFGLTTIYMVGEQVVVVQLAE